MSLFNDYKYKNINTKYLINFKDKISNYRTPWEATFDASNTASMLYKMDLFDSIRIALNTGVDPSNIFIMERGFIDQSSIKSILDYKEHVAFDKLHYYGESRTMIPNRFLNSLSTLMNYKKDIKRLTRNNNFNSFSDNFFYTIIENEQILQRKTETSFSFNKIINTLRKEVDNKISKFSGNKEYLKKEAKNIFGEYSRDLEYIDNFNRQKTKKLIEKSILKKIDIPNHFKEAYEINYRIFFDLLLKLDKPIVGVFDESNPMKFRILCFNAIVFSSEYSNAFIDLKYMAHSSPWLKKFKVPITIASLLAGTTLASIQSVKIYEEIEKIKLEKEKIKLELAQKRYELCKSRIEYLNSVEKMYLEDECIKYLEDLDVVILDSDEYED